MGCLTGHFAGRRPVEYKADHVAGYLADEFTGKLAGRRPDKFNHITISFPAYLPTGFPPTLPTNLSAGFSTNAPYFYVALKADSVKLNYSYQPGELQSALC